MDKGRMPHRACGPFLLAALLAGCGEPSRPSGAENRQLEDAAQMLDRAPAQLEDIDERGLEDFEPERDPFEEPSRGSNLVGDRGPEIDPGEAVARLGRPV